MVFCNWLQNEVMVIYIYEIDFFYILIPEYIWRYMELVFTLKIVFFGVLSWHKSFKYIYYSFKKISAYFILNLSFLAQSYQFVTVYGTVFAKESFCWWKKES